jgi:predicted phage-related endonuclease
MNQFKARSIVTQSRSNIGRCLRILKGTDKRTEPDAYYRACRELKANMADVKRLHKEYPDIRPEKVRQLSIF